MTDIEQGLWGSAEVLDYCGVSPSTLRYWRGLSKHQHFPGEPFPEELCRVNGGPVWLADDVVHWNERRRDNRRSPSRSEPET